LGAPFPNALLFTIANFYFFIEDQKKKPQKRILIVQNFIVVALKFLYSITSWIFIWSYF